MVLVDTGIWIDHLHRSEPRLVELLANARALVHPLVIGELACGSLKSRRLLLTLLAKLPAPPVLTHEEALNLIELRGLHGKGLSFTDVHILGSALLSGLPLWTRDRPLRHAADRLGILWSS